MTTNINEFSRRVSRMLRLVPERAGQVQRMIALAGLQSIVDLTPVDTGRARGATQIGLNEIPGGDPGERSGDEAKHSGEQIINRARPFGVIYIANNVPYFLVLDRGLYEPPNPEDSPKANRRRALRRNARQRKRAGQLAREESGLFNSGIPLVRDGYSKQAPRGMTDLTMQSLVEQADEFARIVAAGGGR